MKLSQQKQSIEHDSYKGKYGNCFSTSIACLLEIPARDVPHFFNNPADNTDDVYKTIRKFLNLKGYQLIETKLPKSIAPDLPSALRLLSTMSPGITLMLSGRMTDWPGDQHLHTVLVKDGNIVWDTSIREDGVKYPNQYGMWDVEYIVKSQETVCDMSKRR